MRSGKLKTLGLPHVTFRTGDVTGLVAYTDEGRAWLRLEGFARWLWGGSVLFEMGPRDAGWR